MSDRIETIEAPDEPMTPAERKGLEAILTDLAKIDEDGDLHEVRTREPRFEEL